MTSGDFVTDIQKIRENARKEIERGAVTSGYEKSVDRKNVINMLNTALATEVLCNLRYKQHYYMCDGMNAQAVAAEFLEHATQEQEHADRLAGRIAQLGGSPDLDPSTITDRAHSEYKPASTVLEMIKENLVAERIAIDSYREMIHYLGDRDPSTRRMLEEILSVEEEHADDLAGLLEKA